MGTRWNISYLQSEQGPTPQAVEAAVHALLEDIENSMSSYRPDSELSRFNRLEAGQWQPVSPGLLQVLETASRLADTSDGAYDITVGPLVDLWGFGPAPRKLTPPSAEEIAATREFVGYRLLDIDRAGARIRKTGPVEVDLSSIAKGYAVDKVAEWLAVNQIDNFLVEIGGEMRLSGYSPRGDNWRIAVEQPKAGVRDVAATLSVSNRGVATSGDYRNFFEHKGQRYSHTLDPRTGRPVVHNLVSVTVVAESAMEADGWATALSVLGPEAGMEIAEAEGLAVYLITREAGGFAVQMSPAMVPFANRN